MKNLTVIRDGELAFGVNLTLTEFYILSSVLMEGASMAAAMQVTTYYPAFMNVDFNLSIAPSGPLCTENLRGLRLT